MVQYKIYATLLDSFQRYLDSEDADSLQELIDRINRKPFVSEAASEGTAFNELVDAVLKHPLLLQDAIEKKYETIKFIAKDGKTYEFKTSVVKEFTDRFQGAVSQVYTEAVLETSKGQVLLYGYADEVLGDTGYDIKTTGQYVFPKYNKNWQHRTYLYTFRSSGVMIDRFEYTVTDFNNVVPEQYVWNDNYIIDLKGICEQLINFIEINRDKITDKKIFASE